jgi:hypothetical protein
MIQKLNDLISRIPSYKNKNLDETTTKQVIILPLLNFLGWDIFNPEEVKAEFLVTGGKVDYSLRIHNMNKVFMEVKRVGTELENHQNQLLNYSFKHGVKLAILTNGITWWFYLPLTEGSWEQRKFYAIDILQQEVIDITDKFESFLSRSNVESGESVEIADKLIKGKHKEKTIKENLPKAWKRIISLQDKLLVDLLAETTEKICGFRPDVEHVEFFLKSIEMYNKLEHIPAIHQVKQSSVVVNPGKSEFNHRLGKSAGQADLLIIEGQHSIKDIAAKVNETVSWVKQHINHLRKDGKHRLNIVIDDNGIVKIEGME